MTLDELTRQRTALLAARYRGVRTVEVDGRRITYATDAEMAAALADRAFIGGFEAGLADLVRERTLRLRFSRAVQASKRH